MTVDGYEVLDIEPDFARDPEVIGARDLTVAALGPAKSLATFTGAVAIHSLIHRYVLDFEDALDFEAFFNARAGRWQPFLVPSWIGELGNHETNSTDSPAAGTDLYIDWCDYANAFGPADGRLGRYVFILWPDDGTLFVTKVESIVATVANVSHRLELADALPKAVPADPGAAVIGFAYLAYFERDDLRMEYRMAGANQTASVEVGFLEHGISAPVADVA